MRPRDVASDGPFVDAAESGPDAGQDASPPVDAAPDADAAADAAPDGPPGCTTGAECDDGVFCNGVETCGPGHACVAGMAVVCPDDGVACTVDACDELAKTCVSSPSDALCPLSAHCDASSGCHPIIYAHDASTLYAISVPELEIVEIGSFGGVPITDIALAPDGTLYAVSLANLYTVDRNSGLATWLAATSVPGANGLEIGLDGVLYAPAPPVTPILGHQAVLYQVNVSNGALAPLTDFPPFYSSSGDVAFVAGRMLATGHGMGTAQNDSLIEVNPFTGASKPIGSTGYPCVWGMALQTDTLYGFTCHGLVLSINPETGQGTKLKKLTPAFLGAAAR